MGSLTLVPDGLHLVPLLALAAILLPLMGVGLLPVLNATSRTLRTGVLGALCTGSALISLVLLARVRDGGAGRGEGGDGVVEGGTGMGEGALQLLPLLPDLSLQLRVDPAGALFAATVAVLGLLCLVYSHGYLAGTHRQGRYYTFFLLCLGFTLGVGYAGNLITFLVFYELFSVLSYPLVVHDERQESMAAGRAYLAYIFFGGGLVTLGVIFTYALAGGDLAFGGPPILAEPGSQGALLGILVLFLMGFGVKAAVFPLHGWVPQAHPTAPAPFSALLSGVMVAAGVFGIARVIQDVFGPTVLAGMGGMGGLSVMASITVVFAGILAIREDHLKRRLAYSTVSQMAYAVLVLSLLGAGAIAGAFVHLTHHAFMKGALFLCAGLLVHSAGIHRVSQMTGVARRMPWTMVAFSVAALGLVGIPPLSGFVSKWVMGAGMVDGGHPAYLAILLGGALLSAFYLLPILYVAYREEAAEDRLTRAREAPWSMLIPTLVAASLTIVLGLGAFLPGFPWELARLATGSLIPSGG